MGLFLSYKWVPSVINSYIYYLPFHFYGVGHDTALVAAQAFTRLEREGFFVKRAGHFRFIALGANHAAAKRHLLAVGAFVLCGIPFAQAGKVEEGYLPVLVLYTYAAIFGYILRTAGGKPCLRSFSCLMLHSNNFISLGKT